MIRDYGLFLAGVLTGIGIFSSEWFPAAALVIVGYLALRDGLVDSGWSVV